MKVLKISWTKFEEDCLFLKKQIIESDLVQHHGVPTTLLAVNRGGLFVAGMLSYMLNIKDVRTLTISPNDFINKEIFTLEKTLIVDTLSDLGETLSIVCDNLQRQGYSKSDNKYKIFSRMAVLYKKDCCPLPIDFYLESIKTKIWIQFPWEEFEIK